MQILAMPCKPSFEPKRDPHKKRWLIYIPAKISSTGKNRREYFERKADALERACELKNQSISDPSLASPGDQSLFKTALDFDMLFQTVYGLKGGLVEACENYSKILDEKQSSKNFKELLDSYESDKLAGWSKPSIDRWKMTRKRLISYSSTPLILMDKKFWKDWINDYARQADWSDQTYNDALNYLSAIWRHAVREEMVDKNPISGIPLKRIRRKHKPVYEVEEVERLMECTWQFDKDMVPFFAITIFAGLRPESEAQRLNWEDVDFEQNLIRVAADFGNKTGTKRFVPIEPYLQKWLSPWKKANGTIIPKNFERRRRYILRGKYQSPAGTLEAEWTDLVPNGSEFADISRHSYGSYLDAKTGGDRKTVMHNMGHTNTTTYEQHYKNARTPDQAERFWKISPLMKQRI